MQKQKYRLGGDTLGEGELRYHKYSLEKQNGWEERDGEGIHLMG